PPPTTTTGGSALLSLFLPASLRLRVENMVESLTDRSLPAPAQVSLAVVLQVRDGRLQVLLWQRARDPFLGAYALPGGYLAPMEDLERSIRRHLAAKVDVRELGHLEQLGTWSDPARHPEEWQVVTGYLGLVQTGLDPGVPAHTPRPPGDDPPPPAFRPPALAPARPERLPAQ